MNTTEEPTRTPVRQYLLPGQAAAPEGPVDVVMMYLLHFAFRRDLQLFEDAARVTPAQDRDAWRALGQRWRLFSEQLHQHHTKEDSGLWPVLLTQANEQERVTLEAMEAEHAELDPLLAGCAAGFERMEAHADQAARRDLGPALVRLRESLCHHLGHEETDAMALVQQHWTQQDWKDMEKKFSEGQGLRDLLRMIPWLMDRQEPEAVAHVQATSPRIMSLFWRLTKPRFDRLDGRARRHLPR